MMLRKQAIRGSRAFTGSPTVPMPTDEAYKLRYRTLPANQMSQADLEIEKLVRKELRRGKNVSESQVQNFIREALKRGHEEEALKRRLAREGRLKLESLWDPESTTHLDYHQPSPHLRHTALMFPGSGSQYPKMGFTFYSKFETFRKTWEEATDALEGWEDWMKTLGFQDIAKRLKNIERTFEDEDEERWTCLRDAIMNAPQHIIMKSSNCQPAILITSIGILRVLEKDFETKLSERADWFLGHSSGEYSAAVASGSISFKDGVRLTRLHGLLTHETLLKSKLVPFSDQEAPDASRGQMTAMLIKPGRTHSEVIEVCRALRSQGELVEVASFNSSAQVVLSGTRRGILLASQELENRGIGARAADLPVVAPFHCSFMEPAQADMQKVLERVTVRRPSRPIISGLGGIPLTEPSQLRDHLVRQISKPVQWTEALDFLRREGCGRMVFIGPGKALSNMARKEIQRGVWKDAKDGEEIDVASVATEYDLERVRVMMARDEKDDVEERPFTGKEMMA